MTSAKSTIKLDGVNRYKTEYAYDHAGRRIRKQVYTNNDSGWVLSRTHKFFYDTVTLDGASSDFGLLTEEEITNHATSSTRTYQYIWGPDLNGSYHGLGGVGGLVAVVDKADNKIYLPLMDAKGTVYKYINTNLGIVVAEFDYDPYGRIMRRSGDQVANLSLRYQTKYHDTETNTYYYGVRHYDPATCRWLSRDPLEEEGGYNLYAFVNNDPVNNVDYLGFKTGHYDDGFWGTGLFPDMNWTLDDKEKKKIDELRSISKQALDKIRYLKNSGGLDLCRLDTIENQKEVANLWELHGYAIKYIEDIENWVPAGKHGHSEGETRTFPFDEYENGPPKWKKYLKIAGAGFSLGYQFGIWENGFLLGRSLKFAKSIGKGIQISLRLQTRLAKWRAYKAGGGKMNMRQWVKHTRSQSWGHGPKSGFGKWFRGHGNRAGNQNAWLYRLETNNGKFLKWGISQNPANRYSKLYMRDKFIRSLRSGPRNKMLQIERSLVKKNPGPLNFEPWAGNL